jgi:hypothetical protein
MSKNKTKKYKHGIEIDKKEKLRIKKSDLLKRIEILENKLADRANFVSLTVGQQAENDSLNDLNNS